MRTTPHAPTQVLLALLAAGALLAGACASNDGGSEEGGGDGGTETTVDTSVLGEKKAATGEPVKIGYVWDGVTDAVDASADLAAADAATEYVNEYLGGIAGRPVELDTCSTDQTPSGASDCVTQMVSDGVPVVLNGTTGQGGSLFEPLSEAGIPVFTTGADPRDAVGATILANGIVAVAAGPAAIFAEQGITNATIVGIDVPASASALQQSAPLFYDNVGVEVDVVLIPPDTPDMTPNIQAALTKDPGGMTVVGNPSFCAKAMSAIASAGFQGELVVIPQCLDEAFLESTTNLEGATMLATASSDPNSDEYQLYQAVMATYAGEDAELGSTAPQAYQAVVGFARAMAGLTGEVTPDTVKAALLAMPPTPMPLGDGITFQCDGKQVTISPSICSQDVLQTTLDAEGNPETFEILPGAELVDLG